MLTIDEIKSKYPIGSTFLHNNEEFIVVGYLEPMSYNYFASYPKIKIQKKGEINGI